MKLADYLKANGVSLEDFGRRIDRSAATISRIARGQGNPDLATIRAITAATEGAVTADDLIADQRRPAPEPQTNGEAA